MKKILKIIPIIICLLIIWLGIIFYPNFYYKYIAKEGNTEKVNIVQIKSSYYTEEDYENVVNETLNRFKEFKDCTLEQISYVGDELNNSNINWAKDNDKDEVITLILSFKTGKHAQGLNHNSQYTSYNMIFARNKGEDWTFITSGY